MKKITAWIAREKGAAFIVASSVLFLTLFLIYPIAAVLKGGLFPAGRFSPAFFINALANPVTRESIANSFMLAGCSVVLTLSIALPLSLLTVRFSFPFKRLLCGLLLVPMIMPPFVGAIGMRQFLARFGSVNLMLMDSGLISSPIDWLGGARFWGIVLMEALHLYPIMWMNISAALANVDPSLEDAAVNMGSSRFSVFRRVTLPLMMPGVFAGGIIVFIWSFTDLGTPLVFEYRKVVAVRIFDRVNDLADNPEGYALVVLVVLMTSAVFLLGKRVFGSTRYNSAGKGSARSVEIPLAGLKCFFALFFVLAVVFVACLPHVAVALTSVSEKWFMTVLPEAFTMSHYEGALRHELTLPAIKNSILFSSMSAVVDVALGVSIAYILARKRFAGVNLLDALAMLPLAVPGLVVAFGYVACFSGTFLDPRENPVPLLVIAYSVRRLPFMVRSAYAGFQQIGVQLEEAAINLGASRFKALRTITFPLMSANLIGGAALVFSFAMLEVSDSLILAIRDRFFPITKAIYQLLGRIEDGPGISAALGVWAMAFLAVSLVTAGVFMGKRMGQMFRV